MAADPYSVLCVPPDAKQEDIRKAYRDLAKCYHPDSGNGAEVDMFHQVREAYAVIGDADKRAKYDAVRRILENPTMREPASRPSGVTFTYGGMPMSGSAWGTVNFVAVAGSSASLNLAPTTAAQTHPAKHARAGFVTSIKKSFGGGQSPVYTYRYVLSYGYVINSATRPIPQPGELVYLSGGIPFPVSFGVPGAPIGQAVQVTVSRHPFTGDYEIELEIIA